MDDLNEISIHTLARRVTVYLLNPYVAKENRSKSRTSFLAYWKWAQKTTKNLESLTYQGVRASQGFYVSLGFALLRTILDCIRM